MEARFMDKVVKQACGCWFWTASKDSNGYGLFTMDGKHITAHRCSHILFKGPIPHGKVLLHSCDTPHCVNPDHLTPGTLSDNMVDREKKGRANHYFGNRTFKTVEERWLAFTKFNFQTGCLEWVNTCGRNTYARFAYKNRKYKAHRFGYELFVGPIPKGHVLCHTCDNPKCVLPYHLVAGTRKENMVDREEKRRGNAKGQKGAKNHQSKLTQEDVDEIRILLGFGFTYGELAEGFGVSKTTVYSIHKSNAWGQNKEQPTFEDVREIRILAGFGFTQSELARRFNISTATVSRIRLGKRYGYVK